MLWTWKFCMSSAFVQSVWIFYEIMQLKEDAIHQGCRLIIHLAGDVISGQLLWLWKTFIFFSSFCYKLQRREESSWEVSVRWASSERSWKLQTESTEKGCWCELSFMLSFLQIKNPYQEGDIRVWLSLLCRLYCPVLENKWESGERKVQRIMFKDTNLMAD